MDELYNHDAIISLFQVHDYKGYNVTSNHDRGDECMCMCVSKFHSAGEDHSRNKRRAHARMPSYTRRPMATRVNARQCDEKR